MRWAVVFAPLMALAGCADLSDYPLGFVLGPVQTEIRQDVQERLAERCEGVRLELNKARQAHSLSGPVINAIEAAMINHAIDRLEQEEGFDPEAAEEYIQACLNGSPDVEGGE